MSDRIGHPGHDTRHVASVPGFETRTLPAPSFNTPSPPAPDNTPSPPPPPAPVDRRDSSSGVRQSDVDGMIAAARAKGDAQYTARLIEAARADGWSVPDQPGTVERIVKAPQDSASYQSPAEQGSHWNLNQRDVEAMVADMRKYGVKEERIQAALKAEGFQVGKAPFVSPEDQEWANANGTVPSSPAGYDVNLAAPGNDKIDPQEFRELHGGLQQAMHAIKLPQELAKSFVREVVSGVSGWRQAQAGGPQAERAYIQEQQRALVRAVGSTKVTEALHDADLCRQMIRKAAPQFERTLNAAGFFLNARAVVAMTQQVARMVELNEMRSRK